MTFPDAKNLTGTIPFDIYFLSALETIQLYSELKGLKNHFYGTIPSVYGKFSDLQFLYLGDTSISGKIPDSSAKFKKRTHINLGTNNFIGTIPAGIGDITGLKQVYFHENQHNETLPDTFFQQSDQTYFFMHCFLHVSWNAYVVLLTIPFRNELCISKKLMQELCLRVDRVSFRLTYYSKYSKEVDILIWIYTVIIL